MFCIFVFCQIYYLSKSIWCYYIRIGNVCATLRVYTTSVLFKKPLKSKQLTSRNVIMLNIQYLTCWVGNKIRETDDSFSLIELYEHNLTFRISENFFLSLFLLSFLINVFRVLSYLFFLIESQFPIKRSSNLILSTFP